LTFPVPPRPSLDLRRNFLPVALIAVSLPASACIRPLPANRGLAVMMQKQVYRRYELVTAEVRVSDPLLLESILLVTGRVCYRGRPMSLVKGEEEFTFRPDGSRPVWRAGWAPPWNPPLGRYTLQVAIHTAGRGIIRDSTCFELAGRSPVRLPPGYCVMTLEDTNNLVRIRMRHPGDGPRANSNFARWAEFLGADAVWYSAGLTIESADSAAAVWFPNNLRVFPHLGKIARENGLKFGCWIGCFFLWGEKLNSFPYTYNIDYDPEEDRLYTTHRVSLLDGRRLRDIVRLARKLQESPVVDYIGLDYIRSGFGGYEMVNRFVDEMDIPRPPGWMSMDFKSRVKWLARRVEVDKEPELLEKWNWWRAHTAARVVRDIIKEAGLTKPVWTFTLGWKMGHMHGQDPLMMLDAGVTWDAVMLYESDAEECSQMNEDWADYLAPGQVPLVLGEEVDWELLQRSLDPPAPEECYRRLMAAADVLAGGVPVAGLFWHDLGRVLWGQLGPFPPREWAIAGAAAFTRFRSRVGRIPLTFSVRADSLTARRDTFRVQLEIGNNSDGTIAGLELRWLKTERLRPLFPARILLGSLAAGKSLAIRCRFATADDSLVKGPPPMAAFELVWDGAGDRRAVAFDYPAGVLPGSGLEQQVSGKEN